VGNDSIGFGCAAATIAAASECQAFSALEFLYDTTASLYARPSFQQLPASTSFANTACTAWLSEQRGHVQLAMPVHRSYVARTRTVKASRSSSAGGTTIAAAELRPAPSWMLANGPTIHNSAGSQVVRHFVATFVW